jgi:hypothetical protein
MARGISTSYKAFPRLADGDQVMVEFDTPEERDAFNKILEEMSEFVKNAAINDGQIYGFKFSSTLHYQVARSESELIRRYFGFRVLNIYTRKDDVVILVEPKV